MCAWDAAGKDRLNKLTQGIMEAENAAALQIVELGMAEASRRLQREMHGICEISFHVPYVKRPKKHQELKDQMEKDAAATFGWLVLAKAMHKTYGYGKRSPCPPVQEHAGKLPSVCCLVCGR